MQGRRPVKPGEHSPRTGVWQGDRGAVGLAGVAQRDRVLGGRHGASRTRERRETQGWQGMKEIQGKTGAKLEKDTGQAGCRAGGRHWAIREGGRQCRWGAELEGDTALAGREGDTVHVGAEPEGDTGQTGCRAGEDTGLAGWEGAERDGGTRQARGDTV